MPQYLYRIQPFRPQMLTEGPTDEEARITGQHFEYLKGLMAEGVVILAGRTTNTDYSSFGIVIFNAESDAAARAIMENDPAIINRVMRGEVFPYRMALLEAANVVAE
jgi:uncharacterized protein YciI